MSSVQTVALIGATGNLGSKILKKLLAANFSVVIITREGSTSTSSLPSHPSQTIKKVDYSSKESITAALKGVDAVVSTVTSGKAAEQHNIIDAAAETGTVKRFIPSDFGSDVFHPKNINLPVYADKIEAAKYLENVVKSHPGFTYTSIMNNAFLDWGMAVGGFIANAKNHTATLWDGGERPFSVTTLGTVGDAVVAVLRNLEATANKTIKIHDAVVTQKQLIEMTKNVDGKEWTTVVKSTEEQEAESWAELKKENPDFGKAMYGFLAPAVWGEGRDIYASQVENDLLGLKEMTEADVQEVVRKVVDGTW